MHDQISEIRIRPEAGPFVLPAMVFANTLKGQSDFARVKGYIIDRFSYFVFQVSVAQGAMICDVALESLIPVLHCWCAEDDVQSVFPKHFIKHNRQGMDYQRLKFRHWDSLLTESMLNHCVSPPTCLSFHLRGLSLFSDYIGRSES